ncbi:MAG: YdcF family protein [Vicinamibacterales bacterium]
MPIPSLLKQALVPGSVGFLVLSLLTYLLLRYVWPRGRRLSRVWSLAIAGTYVVMSLPFVANNIANRLVTTGVDAVASLASADALIILDGDNRVGRAREAERVWMIAQPETVYVLGADWIKFAIIAKGVPRERIKQYANDRTTRDQMEWVHQLLTETPTLHAAVIASRLQMPRVSALAKSAHLTVTLVASPIDDEPPTHGLRAFVPTYVGLRASRDALYEHAALAFYTWRGWIAKA